MNAPAKPNKHVMALVTYLALVPLVYFIPPQVAVIMPDRPLLQVMVAVAIIVPMITYVVMPLFLKGVVKCSQWLLLLLAS